MAEKILEKKSDKYTYEFFDSFFTIKQDFCNFGFLYDDFARSSVHPDEFKERYKTQKEGICKQLSKTGNKYNHFINKDAPDGDIIEGIVKI